MPNVTIDGKSLQVAEGTTVLQAAQQLGIKIPTLCYNLHLMPYGGCRICLVEVANQPDGPTKLVPSCSFPASEGLIVTTESDRIMSARRFIVQLLLAAAPKSEEMQRIAETYGVSTTDESKMNRVAKYLFTRAPAPDPTRCIKCSLCVRVCSEHVGMSAICFEQRGTKRKVTTPFKRVNDACIGCGSCAYVCPTGAIRIEPADRD